MRLTPIISLLLLLSPALHAQPDSPGTGGAPSKREIGGRELAREVMSAHGGEKVWSDQSWNLAFDFVVARDGKESGRFSHEWIRGSNYYTVSGMNREGKAWRVIFTNIWEKRGTATVDGKSVADTLLPRMLEMGYGRFINDTYWFLMPFKLLDSGVNHRRESDTVIDGRTYNVLSLSFGKVGLTPGDRYWIYIEPATKLVARWRYLLESGREGEYIWDEYKEFGSLKLPLRRRTPDGSGEIRFERVRVDRAVEAEGAQRNAQ
jgi:hypothetical protein